MEHNNPIWQTLLEKWNSGNFTRADEQALQRLLAESDPFAREAMEGYLSNPEIDHHKHLENIRARMADKQPKRTPIFQWAAAAAAVLLLLTATWWLLPPKPSDIVANTPHTEPTTADNTPTATGNKPQPSIAPLAKNKALLPTQQRDTSSLLSDSDIAFDDNKDSGAPAVVAAPPQEVIEEPSAYTEAESVKSQPVEEPKPQVIPQPSKPVAVQSSPGAPPVAPAKKRSAVVRVLPTPSVGWEKFNSDMETQVSLTPTAKENGVQSGVVTMIIDINPSDGKIRSVLFINRLGYGCDEIAARFVEQYTWQVAAGGATKMEVEVEFR